MISITKKDKRNKKTVAKKVSKKDIKEKKIEEVKKVVEASKPPATLIVSKKHGDEAEEEMQKYMASPNGFIETFAEMGGDPVTLEVYQAAHMMNMNFLRWINKARQVGMSFCFAAEGLGYAHLEDIYTAIFISINLEEANEKISFARQMYESLPLSIKKKRVVDNKQSLEFEDAAGRGKSRTRLLSYPQREPRGKGHNTFVYLDEIAHYMWAHQIYIAALPIIMRGTGRLTMGSSPLGKDNIHYEVGVDYKKYTGYTRQRIYWWSCSQFIKENVYDEAQIHAPSLDTESRVRKYGNIKIQLLYDSMDTDSFKQEFELEHLDESLSYFPIELINANCYNIEEDFSADPDEVGDRHKYPIEEKYPGRRFKYYRSLEEVCYAVQTQQLDPKLFAGYDVGRRRDKSEVTIMDSRHGVQTLVFIETFSKIPYPDQIDQIAKILDALPGLTIGVDSTGPGLPVYEALKKRFGYRVKGIEFTLQTKAKMASYVRIRMENQALAIPDLKDLKRQIHSIKRRVTDLGNITFDAEKNKEHHGDKFWALAIASSLDDSPFMSKVKFQFPTNTLLKDEKERLVKRVVPAPVIRNIATPGVRRLVNPTINIPIGISRASLAIPTFKRIKNQ